ncbi:unnamed protein product [Acanthoscelides obtectus]|uniref:Uncharacterized protein n=1 Tax=Acanthoscelides obtectus TaxID=200917 RepID=A0A9P0M760_ACAOB|nr:unnamed protein product [Acanthoscelides obtectus]CAK1686011.1 hypothetical protein AOBTE_LOCUS35754 [Acanthoscelides obtectus]
MMYNATPHTTTGKPPAELFFRRQFRDKIPAIPTLNSSIVDEETRDNDLINKFWGKKYSDAKRKAKADDIRIGDQVYVKNTVKENNLVPNFNSTPHTVVKKNGSDVQVENDETGQQYRRNVVHLKKTEGQWKVINTAGDEETSLEQNNEHHT